MHGSRTEFFAQESFNPVVTLKHVKYAEFLALLGVRFDSMRMEGYGKYGQMINPVPEDPSIDTVEAVMRLADLFRFPHVINR